MTDLTFTEFDDAARTHWLERTLAEYAAEREQNGDSQEKSREAADQTHERFFPGDKPVRGQLAGRLLLDGDAVGTLWLGPRDPAAPDSPEWWVWDIEIVEDRRGQGLGRRAMLLAERIAAEHGAGTLGLNVFGSNTVARRLYESLGYATMSTQMSKPLPATD
jgi:ribosomal protein S18 acetylase RimI-like enzyme